MLARFGRKPRVVRADERCVAELTDADAGARCGCHIGHAASRPEQVERVDHHARVVAVGTCDDGKRLRERREAPEGHELDVDAHPELAGDIAELGETLNHDALLVVPARDHPRRTERRTSLEHRSVVLDLDIPGE